METIIGVRRFDSCILKNPEITKEGYLKCDAVPLARAGTIQYEVRPDGKPGTRTDFVSMDELKKTSSALKLLPIVNSHPYHLPGGFIDSTTAKQHQIGYVGETINVDGEFVYANIIITDAKAVQDYKNGKRGLSLGYLVDLVPTAGTFNGKNYEFMQTNRQYNHLALVNTPRAGEMVKIPGLKNMDGYETEIETNPSSQRSRPMPVTINLDGIAYENQAPEVLNHIKKLEGTITGLVAEKKTITANLDGLTGERDTLKSEVGTLKAQIADLPAKIQAGAKARADLETVCVKHLDEAEQKTISTLTDLDLRKKVSLKAFPKMADKINAANEAYIGPVFDSALETLTASNFDSASAAARKAVNGGKAPSATANTDGLPETPEAARKKMEAKVTELWKEPATK